MQIGITLLKIFSIRTRWSKIILFLENITSSDESVSQKNKRVASSCGDVSSIDSRKNEPGGPKKTWINASTNQTSSALTNRYDDTCFIENFFINILAELFLPIQSNDYAIKNSCIRRLLVFEILSQKGFKEYIAKKTSPINRGKHLSNIGIFT